MKKVKDIFYCKEWDNTGRVCMAQCDDCKKDPLNPISPHPEDTCQQCGNRNPTWYAPYELWNKVHGSPNGILCPCCFQTEAELKGFSVVFKAQLIGEHIKETEHEK